VQRTRGVETQNINCAGGGFKEEGSQKGSQGLDLRALWAIWRRLEFVLKALGSHGRLLSKIGGAGDYSDV